MLRAINADGMLSAFRLPPSSGELIEALVAYRDASGETTRASRSSQSEFTVGETTRASPRTSTTSTTGISFGIVSGGGSSSDGSSSSSSSSSSSGSSSDGNPAALSDCELLPHVDTFGSGPDYDAIVARVDTEQLPIDVRGLPLMTCLACKCSAHGAQLSGCRHSCPSM